MGSIKYYKGYAKKIVTENFGQKIYIKGFALKGRPS